MTVRPASLSFSRQQRWLPPLQIVTSVVELVATMLVLVVPFAAATGQVAAVTAGTQPHSSHGLDIGGLDRSVRPGDDFYAYANGTWQRGVTIPPDQSSYGVSSIIYGTARDRTRVLLEGLAERPGSEIGDFYASFMDQALRDKEGAVPVLSRIKAIDRVQTKSALAAEMAVLQKEGVDGLFDVIVSVDSTHPARMIPYLEQAGLGLPDRSQYTGNDASSSALRKAYLGYLTTLLDLSGQAHAATRASDVFAFEAKLAAAHWDNETARQVDKTMNLLSPQNLTALMPGFATTGFLDAAELADQRLLVAREPSAFAGEAIAWQDTPLSVLKDWLTVRVLDRYAPYLSTDFSQANFAFAGAAVSGTNEQTALWKRGVTLLDHEVPDAVGRAYVSAYFPPEAKAAIEEIVRNITSAFRQLIEQVSWMDPETKEKALVKLSSFQIVVGCPDAWRDDTRLIIRRDDLLGNVARAEIFAYEEQIASLSRPVDRRQFPYSAAYPLDWATPSLNEIAFTAASLQSPLFDPAADPAINYGAIGAVIGHELSHHFDDQGRKFDASGRLNQWWTRRDITRFTALSQNLRRQYDSYRPFSDVSVNGSLTLGENLADLAGLTASYQAYRLSLGGRSAPVLDGLSGDQRFFLAYAQSYRSKTREQSMRQDILSDEHSPDPQRVDEVRNVDAWYQAFDVQPGQGLYLPPEQRVRIW